MLLHRTFTMTPPNVHALKGWYHTKAKHRVSPNGLVQSIETRKKNRPTTIDAQKVVPTKRDIREYCLQDLEFKKMQEKNYEKSRRV